MKSKHNGIVNKIFTTTIAAMAAMTIAPDFAKSQQNKTKTPTQPPPVTSVESQFEDNIQKEKLGLVKISDEAKAQQKELFLGQIVYHLHNATNPENTREHAATEQKLLGQYELTFDGNKNIYSVKIKSWDTTFTYTPEEIKKSVNDIYRGKSNTDILLSKWKELSQPQGAEQTAKRENEVERSEVLQQAMLTTSSAILDIFNGREKVKNYVLSQKDGNLLIRDKALNKTFTYTPKEVEEGFEAHLTHHEDAKNVFRNVLKSVSKATHPFPSNKPAPSQQPPSTQEKLL